MARITGITNNLNAFLDMIAWSEIGPDLLKVSDDGYNVLVGSTAQKPLLFDSYVAPPEWYDKALDSTASGRYQILHRYADDYMKILGLPDYSPESQDRIAIQLVRECHALELINTATEDSLREAVADCSSRWASLPGNSYDQHENAYTDLRQAFLDAGGTINGG